MADNKVKFLRGTAAEYESSIKDNDTFYYTTDTKKLYLGNKEITSSSVTIDDTISDTSKNPVQNKVIKAALDEKASTAVATQSANGLMSAADKKKLDGIEANANHTEVDAELSETSENPVQNKVIAELLSQIGGGIKVITGTFTTGKYEHLTVTINIGAKPIAVFTTPGYSLSNDSQRNVYLCIGDQIVNITSFGVTLQITDYGFSHTGIGGEAKFYYLAIVNE